MIVFIYYRATDVCFYALIQFIADFMLPQTGLFEQFPSAPVQCLIS